MKRTIEINWYLPTEISMDGWLVSHTLSHDGQMVVAKMLLQEHDTERIAYEAKTLKGMADDLMADRLAELARSRP